MKIILSFLFFASSLISLAQPGTNDTTFNTLDDGEYGTGNGFDNQVKAIAIQADGKHIFGGDFTLYNSITAKKIIRLNDDGSIDPSFYCGSGFNNSVNAIAIQTDGKIIAGGDFTTYNGTSIKRLVRLNSDGSIDNSFSVGSGFNFKVNDVQLQADGKVLVGGNFTSYNATTQNYITRLNTDGTIDAAFASGTGFDNAVKSIALQNDQAIVVGGSFNFFDGTSSNCIARLLSDGTVDPSFTSGTGFNNTVNCVRVQSDGKILAGGIFTSFNSVNRKRLARLNSNGTLDAPFNNSTNGFNDEVLTLELLASGKILVSGLFSYYNITQVSPMVRLTAAGGLDNTFASNGLITQNNTLGTIDAIKIQSDEKIVIGGYFSKINTDGNLGNKARLSIDGQLDLYYNYGSGFNDLIRDIQIQPDGKILVAGDFTKYRNTVAYRIARLHPDGTLDTTFNVGTGPNGSVYSLSLQADGKIVVGGYFGLFNSVSKGCIARVFPDGSLDNSLVASFDLYVTKVMVQDDGKIMVGGVYSVCNSQARKILVRLTNAGSLDLNFDLGNQFTGELYALAIQPDGKYLIGGSIYYPLGNLNNIKFARLNTNGTIDGSFNINSGFNAWVHSIALQNDGKIYVGGNFTTYNGAAANRLVRLNANGDMDATFSVNTGFNTIVTCLAVQSNNQVIVGGNFTSAQNTTKNRICRLNLDGSLDNSFDVGSGFNGNVSCSQIQADGRILIGGKFTDYNTNYRSNITRILNCFPEAKTDTLTACDSLIWRNGITYINSNDSDQYIVPNSTLSGCDSVYNLQLTIYKQFDTLDIVNCGTYTFNEVDYTSSGTFNQSVTHIPGCNSQYELNITINPPTTSSISYLNDSTLTATVNDSYQWIDCANNNLLDGETTQTLILQTNGSYACIGTNADGCSDTSNCIVINNLGLDHFAEEQFTIAPNPASNSVVITFNPNEHHILQVIDAQGKTMQSLTVQNGDNIDLHQLKSGVYFFRLTTKNGTTVQRVVKYE
jgi:uncharacterized delta-60 repeat protein